MADGIREALEALIKELRNWRCERPDEWKMDEIIHLAKKAALQSAQGEPLALLVREIGETSWFDHPPVKPGTSYAENISNSPILDHCYVYAHPAPVAVPESPAQSVEEIQAGALEDFADVQATKAEQWRHKGSLTNEQFHIDCAEQAYEQAARLRQSGNAGEES